MCPQWMVNSSREAIGFYSYLKFENLAEYLAQKYLLISDIQIFRINDLVELNMLFEEALCLCDYYCLKCSFHWTFPST